MKIRFKVLYKSGMLVELKPLTYLKARLFSSMFIHSVEMKLGPDTPTEPETSPQFHNMASTWYSNLSNEDRLYFAEHGYSI